MDDTTQTDLDIGIGTKEPESLQPATVKIEKVEITTVGADNNEILYCHVKYPDRDDLVRISEVKQEKNGKLNFAALWISKDDDGLLAKGSALALFLASQNVKTPKELEGKEVETILDDKNYLAFKAY